MKILSLERNWSKEHYCSRAIFAWATIPWLGQKYFLARLKHLSLGQNWTWEHLSSFQVSSPRRECLAWTSYAKSKDFTNELQQFLLPLYYHTCLKWLNWVKINPHTRWMIYPNTNYLFNRSTYHQFSQNHIIHARTDLNKKIKSQFQTYRDFHICISQTLTYQTLTYDHIQVRQKWRSASLTWIALEVLSNSPKA